MTKPYQLDLTTRAGLILLLLSLPPIATLVGCNGDARLRPAEVASSFDGSAAGAEGMPAGSDWALALPPLSPARETGTNPLRVVATTSIIGDVVARVGGDAIDLVVLMKPDQDPHAYEPSARDLARVSEAEVVFVNGWDLEASLVRVLEQVGQAGRVLPISAGITPRVLGNSADPHVWLDVRNVLHWVDNVELVLGELDPANRNAYQLNAGAYRLDLEALVSYIDGRMDALSPDRRKLVTNHDALGYLADRYQFELVGTVIPAIDTLAEPSASGMSRLVEQMEEAGVCTIFIETTANDRLARTVAAELASCQEVQVLTLHTGAIGPPGSDTGSYIGMMRANVDAIFDGLSE